MDSPVAKKVVKKVKAATTKKKDTKKKVTKKTTKKVTLPPAEEPEVPEVPAVAAPVPEDEVPMTPEAEPESQPEEAEEEEAESEPVKVGAKRKLIKRPRLYPFSQADVKTKHPKAEKPMLVKVLNKARNEWLYFVGDLRDWPVEIYDEMQIKGCFMLDLFGSIAGSKWGYIFREQREDGTPYVQLLTHQDEAFKQLLRKTRVLTIVLEGDLTVDTKKAVLASEATWSDPESDAE